MAVMIPENIDRIPDATPGERKVFRLLKEKLPDDVLVWFNVPIRRSHPDFIILHPRFGLLVLEVKDWLLASIKSVTPERILLDTPDGDKTATHPLKQARSYVLKVVNLLAADPLLTRTVGPYQGNLLFPFGYGVVWVNIKEDEFMGAVGGFFEEAAMLFRETINAGIDTETLTERLRGLFPTTFGFSLSQPQIDRIRFHLFPEVRVSRRNIRQVAQAETQPTLPNTELDDDTLLAVMDYEQEKLAKNLGDGHRLLRGVAGSGKTWTLICRARLLAETHAGWRILVLCYNATLAAYLRQTVTVGISEAAARRIRVETFHSLLMRLTREAKLPQPDFSSKRDASSETARTLVEKIEADVWKPILYDAVLIDETHDFPSEWLALVVKLVNPATDSLFVVYDGAQNIYRRGFSFVKVGIKVRGRSRLLKTNYRNTREIAECAAEFLGRGVQFKRDEDIRDDEGQLLEIVRPQASSRSGPPPLLIRCEKFREECAEAAARVKRWIESGEIPPEEILVLYVKRGPKFGGNKYVEALLSALDEAGVKHEWISRDSKTKRELDVSSPTVKVSTIHSAKGLDFEAVVMVGLSLLPSSRESAGDERKLVYIGMTRARRRLIVTWCRETEFVSEMLNILESN